MALQNIVSISLVPDMHATFNAAISVLVDWS
jgi:hypothetical protein